MINTNPPEFAEEFRGIFFELLDTGTDLQAGRQPVAGLSSVPIEEGAPQGYFLATLTANKVRRYPL